jgi:xylulokinase
MKTVLGLDLGTQSLKAVFYNYHAKEIVCTSSCALELYRDEKGSAEQKAEWWLSALKDCLSQAPESVLQSVQAIGISGQQHGFVALDANGEVLLPVKLWCDTATQEEVAQITARCGGSEAAFAMTGNPVVAGFTSPKVLWLKNHRPDLYAKLAHILLPHDYLNYILTGELAMEYGDASGTGLLDVRTRQWSKAMLQALDDERDLAACLPQLVNSTQFIGATTEEFSASYGLPVGIPVASGGGDNMLAAIGTGNVSAGKLTMSLGSSGTLYAYSETPVIDPEGIISAFCSSTDGWLPLLCTMNCTLATDLIRQAMEIELDQVDELVSTVAPGSDGLVALPFFHGERTPDLPEGRGCFLGITPDNFDKTHMLRSVMEATIFGLKFGLDKLKKLGVESSEVVLTGGGANSRQWCQIVADVFQLPVTILAQQEGASFGAALQALWVLQSQDQPGLSITQICEEHVIPDARLSMKPNVDNADQYALAYNNYQRALEQVSPLYRT